MQRGRVGAELHSFQFCAVEFQSPDSTSVQTRSREHRIWRPRGPIASMPMPWATTGESSSKDTPIDLSPPADDAKAHPQSSDILMDAEAPRQCRRE